VATRIVTPDALVTDRDWAVRCEEYALEGAV
jgi:hypothetical protein